MPDEEVIFSLHVIGWLELRGVTREEIIEVLKRGEEQEAEKGRLAKEFIFQYNGNWRGKFYEQKKVRAIYVLEDDKIVVITVFTYYGKWR